QPRHSYSHSASRTTNLLPSRFLSLKAFGRRPRCKPHRRHGPASETLNISDVLSARQARPLCPCAFNRSVQHRLQSIGWRLEAQGLSRALIEPQSNCVQITLRDAREIGSSREVLPQQAVGVLV